MPKQATHLTDKAIRTCEIKLKEYIMVDGNGLNIRIRPNGTNSWQFRYSDKKVKKIALGSYTKTG